MIILIGLGACAVTFLGGLFALYAKDQLHLLLGFSAGAVIGVAFFDLLPESLNLAGSFGPTFITSLVGGGFVFYLLLDRMLLFHNLNGDCHNHNHCHEKRSWLTAGTLAIHSVLDGLAVGLAIQVSWAVGLIVAVAVLAHDFSDGVNMVGVTLKNGGSRNEIWRWLTVDAIAPVIGIAISTFLYLQKSTLGVILALFCGFFLYIGASELLPGSHHSHPTFWTTAMTFLGLVVIFVAVKMAGI